MLKDSSHLQLGAPPSQDNNPYKTQTNALDSEWYPIIWGNASGYIYHSYLALYSNEGLLLMNDNNRWSFAIITAQ